MIGDLINAISHCGSGRVRQAIRESRKALDCANGRSSATPNALRVAAGLGLAELALRFDAYRPALTKAVFDGRNRPFTIRDCVRADATDLNSITIDGGTLLRFNALTI